MSLYDIMNKKPKQAPVVESVEAVESAEPFTPTHAVMDSEAIASVAAPVQEAPQTVTQEKKPYTWWWQTPDFVGAVESQAKAAEKRAEQDRKRARRERNAAILGDLAKLGAQMYAKNGGAWKIDPFTPATEKTNDKLAALRERHAAEVAAFARQRAAAKQAQIADNNARMKLETSLAEADLDRRIKAEKDARDFAYKVTKDEFDAKIAAQNAESRRISANASAGRASGGSGANKPGRYLAYDKNGNERWFDSEQAAEIFSRSEGTWHEEDYNEVSVVNDVDEYGERRERTINSNKTVGYSKKPTSPMNKKNNQGDGGY